uniref:Classical arabinogalactan protein 26 n=1 Tax=Elaeis guineensis var. tenera TaxID=51953 RepID=A0A6I9R704_ELAGV|nr:classical arabinogalactan protein 26 [Elaeis guineensis]
MATTTSSFTPFCTHTQLLSFLATLLLLTSPTPSCSFTLELKVSGISAAPALLPIEPTISSIPPTLAPDMMPLFPSPGGSAGAAPAGTLPTIPSSPSPPNPDELEPNSAITPSGSAAASSAASSSSLRNLGGMSMVLVCGLVLMWWLELVD